VHSCPPSVRERGARPYPSANGHGKTSESPRGWLRRALETVAATAGQNPRETEPLAQGPSALVGGIPSAPSLARFADALLRGDLLSPDSRQQLLRFVPAGDGYDGYGLGVGKGQQGTDDVWYHFGAGPGFVTVAGHVPAKEITVAALSSGDADLRLLTTLLTQAALEAD
jgi:hypothetical protein